jgi:hypothetical protein
MEWDEKKNWLGLMGGVLWVQDRLVWVFVVTRFRIMHAYMLLYGLYVNGCGYDIMAV